ncbi:hypothetical protein GCM10009103_26130 [Pseudomonas koreensis]|nr:hypothetical protein GCM10009103_26130 [Pseudomonas koreensis]
MPAHAPDEMLAGTVQDVVSRFMPRHVLRAWLILRAFDEAHERMQMVSFALHLLDPPLQLAAQFIAGHHRRAVTVTHAPQHFVQQAPALVATVSRGLLEGVEQCTRDARLKRPLAFRHLHVTGKQITHAFRRPAHQTRIDLMAEQPARLLPPGVEQVIAIEIDHPHNPICCGCGRSRSC